MEPDLTKPVDENLNNLERNLTQWKAYVLLCSRQLAGVDTPQAKALRLRLGLLGGHLSAAGWGITNP